MVVSERVAEQRVIEKRKIKVFANERERGESVVRESLRAEK